MILDEQSEGIMKRISDNGMRQEAVNRKGNGIDFADLQKIIKEKAQLQKLYISL